MFCRKKDPEIRALVTDLLGPSARVQVIKDKYDEASTEIRAVEIYADDPLDFLNLLKLFKELSPMQMIIFPHLNGVVEIRLAWLSGLVSTKALAKVK